MASGSSFPGALALLACLSAACVVPLDVVDNPDGGARAGRGGTSASPPGTGGSPAGAGTGGAAGAGGAPALPGASVVLTPAGAAFTGSLAVTLTAPEGGQIHYTLDGSLPTSASAVYRAPVALTGSTVLRAFAIRPGQPAGTVGSASFVQVASELASWSSNLPVVLLHTHQQGALAAIEDGPLVAGSMLALAPGAGGRTTLVGPASSSARAGMRVRGASSVTFPQKSYSVELRDPGSDLDAPRPLLGLSAESDFALVGGSYMDRSLMRNALAYALSNSVGRWAPRTRFVEVFLVEAGGPVRATDYRGVYTLTETIKRDPGRLAISKLGSTALDPPLVTGGYIVRIDKGLPHFNAGGNTFQYVYPHWEEIKLPPRERQRRYIEGLLQEFMTAVARPDFRHPATGKHYRDYIDVPSFVDHNLINLVTKNVDAFRLSAYFHKTMGGTLHAGPVWDFDRSSGTPHDDSQYTAPRALDPREWARDDATHHLQWGFWGRLFGDPTFKAAHSQRFAELARGPFAPAAIHAIIDGFAAELTEAQARHFARWRETPPAGGGHAAEVAALKQWFSARIPWLQTQL